MSAKRLLREGALSHTLSISKAVNEYCRSTESHWRELCAGTRSQKIPSAASAFTRSPGEGH